VARSALTVGVVVAVFAGVLPRIADYSAAWDLVRGLTATDVPWVVVLAVFSLTRLVTLVPITPGALGVAELSSVAGLTAVGVDPASAAGTVLLFRFLTWFLPIPTGIAAWLLWRHGVGHDRGAPAGAGP